MDYDILLSLYLNEFRAIYVGNRKSLDLQFLDAVEELFGATYRDKTTQELRGLGV